MAAARLFVGCGALSAAISIAGCEGPNAGDPVGWWHGLEGGRIAQVRVPPPGADDPYPSLATVPGRPQGPDPATQARVAQALIQDRSNADYTAAAQPIVPPPTAAPRPAAAAPTDADASSASLVAASANPVAPPPARRNAPQTSRVPAAAGADTADAGPRPVTNAAATAAELPTIPDAPPPPPRLSGVRLPAVTVPVAAPVAPPKPPPAPAAPGAPVAIAFAVGSDVLPIDSVPSVRAFGASRNGRAIAVTGFGEAVSSDPAAQAQALPLALARARAVASTLISAGVPPLAIRLAAESSGTGAAMRLTD